VPSTPNSQLPIPKRRPSNELGESRTDSPDVGAFHPAISGHPVGELEVGGWELPQIHLNIVAFVVQAQIERLASEVDVVRGDFVA